MRYLILFAALLWADASYADDVRIRVDYTTSTYRVRPNPGPTTERRSIEMVMHPDSTIDDRYYTRGRHPVSGGAEQKLGATNKPVQYRVVNNHTISRKSKNIVITVTVTNNTCMANIVPTHGPSVEFEGTTGTLATYRDLKILGTSCIIQ
jgi:hypothetical protein